MNSLQSKILTIIIMILMFAASSLAQEGKHSGIILEILESGGYSYFYVEEGDKTFWIAVRQTPAFVGAHIEFDGQIWMADFYSKTLGKTFPKILFSGSAKIGKPDDKETLQQFAETDHAKISGTIAIVDIKRQKELLKNSQVVVQGELVKVTHKVMGKTWVHIRDGDADSSKIVITTLDNTVEVGMRVSAKGRLSVDKDFGMGYFYPSIIEDAVITK